MDDRRFDGMTRHLAGRLDRRRALRLAAATLAPALGLALRDGAAAGRAQCRAEGAGCTRDGQCCLGVCVTGRHLPRRERNRCRCVPDCAGRECGSDGCGGSCGDACEGREVCIAAGICVACHPDSYTYFLDQTGAWIEYEEMLPLPTTVGCTRNDDCAGEICTTGVCVCGALQCIYGEQSAANVCFGRYQR